MQLDHSDDNRLEWSRAGYSNPAHLIRSHIQRVAYKLDKQKLLRLSWPVLDRAQDTKEMQTEVLSEIESLEWRFLDDKNEWTTSWPESDEKASQFPLPKAVEVNLELKDWGKIKRLILLVDNV
jgi:general secretion pathway protein J